MSFSEAIACQRDIVAAKSRLLAVGSEVAHRVSLTLATVRRSNRACRSPAHGFHEDAFEVPKEEAIQPGQPAGPAVVQPDRSMNGPSWEPVRLIPSTSLLERERTGFSLKELFRPPSPLLIWFSFLFPTIFAGSLPRPNSVASCLVTWLSPRFIGTIQPADY